MEEKGAKEKLEKELVRKDFGRAIILLVLHSDKGSLMKGVASEKRYTSGIMPSKSRVSNDNSYVEILLKVLKYVYDFQLQRFASLEETRP